MRDLLRAWGAGMLLVVFLVAIVMVCAGAFWLFVISPVWLRVIEAIAGCGALVAFFVFMESEP